MFSRLSAIVITLGIILFAGWITLHRPDIPFEQLESIYANKESRYLAIDEQTRIHFRDVGPRDAPAIVLVHGFSASLHTWDMWTEDLKRDYRIISLDLPGHGLSNCIDNSSIGTSQFVDVISRLTRALQVEKFSLAGSSMGGAAAWNFALTAPERLDSLILVDSAGWPQQNEEAGNRPLIFSLLQIGLARQLMKDLDLTALIRSGLEDSFADPALVTDEMVERYAALARAPCHRDALLALSAGQPMRATASPEQLSAITVPALVMHGERDNLVPVSHARDFAAAIPGAELIIYPAAGHLPQEENARQSVADLRDFLARRVYPENTGVLAAP
jgi:pimeloyl-ACP methyl ester carboxylesterase